MPDVWEAISAMTNNWQVIRARLYQVENLCKGNGAPLPDGMMDRVTDEICRDITVSFMKPPYASTPDQNPPPTATT